MSQENLDTVRAGERAFAEGNWEWYRTVFDPNVLARFDARWPEQCVYGRENVIAFFRSGRETLGSKATIEDVRDLGDRVLIRWTWKTRGDHSGIEHDLCWSQLDTFRNGRIILSEYFLDHEDALRSLGMQEPLRARPMPQTNLEVVRGFVAPADGEDLIPLMRELVERFGPDYPHDPIVAFWSKHPAWRHVDPEIEWTSELPGLAQQVNGPSELLEWWRDLLEVWDSYVYRTVELRDLGDWVLNVADIAVRGRQGIDVDMRAFELVRVRNGKIVTYRAAFQSEIEALKAVGLER